MVVHLTKIFFAATIYQNVQSASKGLQYGEDKCKYMNINSFDSWETSYDNSDNLIENYSGKVDMRQVSSIKYLGFVCSEDGTNIKNIQILANKSIGIKKQFFI